MERIRYPSDAVADDLFQFRVRRRIHPEFDPVTERAEVFDTERKKHDLTQLLEKRVTGMAITNKYNNYPHKAIKKQFSLEVPRDSRLLFAPE